MCFPNTIPVSSREENLFLSVNLIINKQGCIYGGGRMGPNPLQKAKNKIKIE